MSSGDWDGLTYPSPRRDRFGSNPPREGKDDMITYDRREVCASGDSVGKPGLSSSGVRREDGIAMVGGAEFQKHGSSSVKVV